MDKAGFTGVVDKLLSFRAKTNAIVIIFSSTLRSINLSQASQSKFKKNQPKGCLTTVKTKYWLVFKISSNSEVLFAFIFPSCAAK
jgi:hypothetical protein